MNYQHITTQLPAITITILIFNQCIISEATKQNARPVHETLNENPRIDKGMKNPKPASHLPFSNPLTNARAHAQTQQAMFNAERIRQHRAQLQRSTKTPLQMDSYMKAYHESQENHQIALEMEQTKRENRQTMIAKIHKPNLKAIENKNKLDVTKLTAADAVKNNKRNQRSHGISAFNHLKRYQNVYVTAAPTYDQGVTIKPNGNVGLSSFQPTEATHLFTEAVPSNTQHVYPKQHNQMLNYQSVSDLEHIFKKEQQKEMAKLSNLLHSASDIQEIRGNSELQTPIDLFFYLKDKPYTHGYTQNYNQGHYAQLNYLDNKDHIPITEEIDDIENPDHTMRPFTTPQNTEMMQETVTESNREIEHLKAMHDSESKSIRYQLEEEKPHYQAYEYPHKVTYYHHQKEPEELNEKYFHHNANFNGIHHLKADGTVSPYEDDLHYAVNYEFGYRVHDLHHGNDFGHHESKKGEETKGHYHVLLPDGRVQKVMYRAGPEGFHADISYDHLKYGLALE